MGMTFEKGPPIASPTWPMAPSGLNCLPIAPPEETTEGFYRNNGSVVIFGLGEWRGKAMSYLRVGVLGFTSSLSDVLNALVSHASEAESCRLEGGGGGSRNRGSGD